MVKHIVMYCLNGTLEDRAALSAQFKTAIEALPAQIEQLDAVEVGVNDGPAEGNWYIALTALCADYAALQAYAGHPAHLACVAIIKPAIAARACVDYVC